MLGNFIEPNSDTKFVTVDIETVDPFLKESGASWAKGEGCIVGIAVKLDNEESCYYPIGHRTSNYDFQQVKNYIWNLFMFCYDHSIPIGMHYGYYDLGWLSHYEFIDIKRCPPIYDTLNVSQLYNNIYNSYSLENLVKQFQVGEKMKIELDQLLNYPINFAAKYACNDTDITYNLAMKLQTLNILQAGIERETKIIPILVQMKKEGISVDLEQIESLERKFSSRLTQLILNLTKYQPKVNIWSGQSIEMLFRSLQLSVPRTEKGNPSFEQATLETIARTNPIIADLAEARKLHKLINTFIKGTKEKQYKGKIHPDYFNGRSDYGGTITGRLSSANPNIQQIPSRTESGMEIRSIFITHKAGCWSRFDYSQQEPRLMIHYASLTHQPTIETWVERFSSDPKADFYSVLMEATGRSDRNEMKTNTLALAYGMGIAHMSDIMGTSEDEARESKTNFFEAVPWLPGLSKYVTDQAARKGEIRTIGDRVLKYRPIDSNKQFNKLIQGSAADQTKQAMIDIYEQLGKIPLVQVHDELGYELSPKELEMGDDVRISSIMKNTIKLEIPSRVDVSYGWNWKEACKK